MGKAIRMESHRFGFKRLHKEEYFYKYTSATAAKAILRTGKFRYSSPLIFNDPFDNQAGMHIDFDVSDFVGLFFNRLEEIVISDREPVFEDFNAYSKTTMMMRNERLTCGFPRGKLVRTLGPIVQSFAEKLKETHAALIDNWNRDIARMRMFCVSEEFENIQMWSHYADYHRGVVLKLKVADSAEADDPLWLAKRVNYVSKALPLFTIAHIDEILGMKKFEFKSLHDLFAYTKFDIWRNEREWRCFNLEDQADDRNFSDYTFRLDKIAAVIFGCRTENADMNEISNLARDKNNQVAFMKAIRHPYEYRLDFEPIP